jgi:glycosyltransferase involved in cell wall biosynthesis
MTGTPSASEYRDRPIRMLYLYPDTMGPSTDPRKNALAFLSRYFEGDWLTVWWTDSAEEARQRAPALNKALGRFRLHWTRSYRLPPVVRHLWDVVYFVTTGVALRLRSGRYDLVVAYGPFRTAFAAWILRHLIGARFIVEIPGNYWRHHASPDAGLLQRFRARLAPAFATFMTRRADHVRMLYPGQVPHMEHTGGSRTSLFHSFTAVHTIPQADPSERYILFLGFPWFLKGVDVLIQAFNRISPRHPDVHLRIVGHCPDRTPFEALANGNPRISLERAVPHEQAMALMAGCSLFVLPSRTDACPRVVLEAMSARKPIIATAVDGIPHYVRDNDTGILVPPGNVEALAEALDRVLSDAALSERLAHRGNTYAHEVLSEERYTECFLDMAERTLGRSTVAEANQAEPRRAAVVTAIPDSDSSRRMPG